MKFSPVLFSIFILASTLTSPALSKNLPQGTVEIGGDLDIGFTNTETTLTGSSVGTDTDTRTIEFMVAYYFAQNIGIGILWNNVDTDITSGSFSSNTNTNLIGPTIILNHSLSEPLNLVFRGALVLSDTTVSSSTTLTEGSDGNGFLIGGGLRYFAAESVSFDFTLDYVSLSEEIHSTNENFDTDGTRLGVGITVYIY